MQNAPALENDDVQAAFRSLEQVSQALDASYRSLESRVARLNEELAASRSARLRELAEKEQLLQRLSNLMAVLPGGVLLIDREGRVRDANPQAFAIYGEPLLGEPWDTVAARPLQPAADQRERRVSVATRHLDSAGEQVVLVSDTTEVHALQAQLGREQRLRALGEMAARMTHEIRTPLASLTLYLSRLRSADLEPGQRQQICDKLSARLGEMEGLIGSVLGFVRGDTVPHDSVVLQDVLCQFEELMQPRLQASGSSLQITPVDRSLIVHGVRDDLVSALCNLAGNAIDAGRGEPVVITLWIGALSAGRVRLRLADNGSGIEPSIMHRLFDPFFTTRAGGVGLGLAVVDKTVTAMGGEVRVTREPEQGAEFVIDLPLLSAQVEAQCKPG